MGSCASKIDDAPRQRRQTVPAPQSVHGVYRGSIRPGSDASNASVSGSTASFNSLSSSRGGIAPVFTSVASRRRWTASDSEALANREEGLRRSQSEGPMSPPQFEDPDTLDSGNYSQGAHGSGFQSMGSMGLSHGGSIGTATQGSFQNSSIATTTGVNLPLSHSQDFMTQSHNNRDAPPQMLLLQRRSLPGPIMPVLSYSEPRLDLGANPLSTIDDIAEDAVSESGSDDDCSSSLVNSANTTVSTSGSLSTELIEGEAF